MRNDDRFTSFAVGVSEGLAWYQVRRRWRAKGQGVIARAPFSRPNGRGRDGCSLCFRAKRWVTLEEQVGIPSIFPRGLACDVEPALWPAMRLEISGPVLDGGCRAE